MRPPLDALPTYEQRRVIVLRKWWEDLTDEMRADARAARAQRAEKTKERRRERVSIAERIIEMFDAGKSVEETAARFGWSTSNLRKRCAAFGIPISSRSGLRKAPAILIEAEQFEALARLAADRMEEPALTLARLVSFHLADDATVARRELRTPRGRAE